MIARPARGMAVLGRIVIAVTCGLSRFVFGVFPPMISDDLSIGTAFAGTGRAPAQAGRVRR